MTSAKLSLHPNFVIDTVDDRIFGGFLEHLGQCIYSGVFQPDHPAADEDGLRSDLRAALAELEVSVVRYPGGNFVSGYHWEDGVGPSNERPMVRELAWKSLEPNLFGTDEFIRLCKKLDWIPMLAVNLGTGSPEEARNWLEYCNGKAGTRYADKRVTNGNEEPHGVSLWCLGNEMDGPWQLGHVPAEVYGSNARQAAKMMKDLDPSIETVACGSSSPQMPTFLEWDRTVLETVGQLADYISLHRYVGNDSEDAADYLSLSHSIDAQIEAVDACVRYVAANSRPNKRAYLCFDEWNVWYRNRGPRTLEPEVGPPMLEERYNFEDALVAAMFLMSFIRHADVVKVANLAQLVNVIAPIVTNGDAILKQTIFHSFRMISSRKHGVALRQNLECDTYVNASGESISFVDSATMLDGSELKVFLINRNLRDEVNLELSLLGKSISEVLSAEVLHHSDLKAENSFENPDEVVSTNFDGWRVGTSMLATLPPQSFVATTFRLS